MTIMTTQDIYAACARAQSSAPGWGPGWVATFETEAGQELATVTLPSIEQIEKLVEGVGSLGFRLAPRFEGPCDFVFVRAAS